MAHLMIFENNGTEYLASISHRENISFIFNDFSFNSRVYYEFDTLDYQINWNKEGEGYWYGK